MDKTIPLELHAVLSEIMQLHLAAPNGTTIPVDLMRRAESVLSEAKAKPQALTARVLISVRGGIADFAKDDGADVFIYDFDCSHEYQEANGRAPARFKDLAADLSVPVQACDCGPQCTSSKGMGIGPYDNEGGEHHDLPGYMDGHWYINRDCQLYIVPNAEAEIEGPDDETLDKLNSIYRAASSFDQVDTAKVAEDLGLHFVQWQSRRFSWKHGYYMS